MTATQLDCCGLSPDLSSILPATTPDVRLAYTSRTVYAERHFVCAAHPSLSVVRFRSVSCLCMSSQGWSRERAILDQGSRGRLLLVQASDPAAHVKKVGIWCCAH